MSSVHPPSKLLCIYLVWKLLSVTIMGSLSNSPQKNRKETDSYDPSGAEMLLMKALWFQMSAIHYLLSLSLHFFELHENSRDSWPIFAKEKKSTIKKMALKYVNSMTAILLISYPLTFLSAETESCYKGRAFLAVINLLNATQMLKLQICSLHQSF